MSQVLLKLHNVFWFCDKLHTKASSESANKQGIKLQRCADCASEVEHCQKAGPKKALYHFYHNWPFSGLSLFKNEPSCIFITHITIIHCICDFSFWYKMYTVIKMFN